MYARWRSAVWSKLACASLRAGSRQRRSAYARALSVVSVCLRGCASVRACARACVPACLRACARARGRSYMRA
eukprot:1384388-Alexandrium_andersonii.AAC.1